MGYELAICYFSTLISSFWFKHKPWVISQEIVTERAKSKLKYGADSKIITKM